MFEDYNISRCKKCCAFGHTIKNCLNNKAICSYCAGNHDSEMCNTKGNKKCINCCISNDAKKTRYNIYHHAHDFSICDIYKKLKHNVIKNTRY